MKSVRNLKNAIVEASLTELPVSSLNIHESAYKIAHKTSSSNSRFQNHSIERKKSPVQSYASYRNSNKSPSPYKPSQRTDNKHNNLVQHPTTAHSAMNTLNNTLVPSNKKPATTTNKKSYEGSIYDQLKSYQSASSSEPFQSTGKITLTTDTTHRQKMTSSGIMCLRRLWENASKLEEKQHLAVYAHQIKDILNKICRASLKPEFQFNQNSGFKENNNPNYQTNRLEKRSDLPGCEPEAIKSSPYSPSHTKNSIFLQESLKGTPKQLQFRNNINQFSSEKGHLTSSNEDESEMTHPILEEDEDSEFEKYEVQTNIEYKKILYMLQRKSKGQILDDEEELDLFYRVSNSNISSSSYGNQRQVKQDSRSREKKPINQFNPKTGKCIRGSSPSVSTVPSDTNYQAIASSPIQKPKDANMCKRVRTEADQRSKVNLRDIVGLFDKKYQRNGRLSACD